MDIVFVKVIVSTSNTKKMVTIAGIVHQLCKYTDFIAVFLNTVLSANAHFPHAQPHNIILRMMLISATMPVSLTQVLIQSTIKCSAGNHQSRMVPQNLGAFITLLLATALPFCMCAAQNTYYIKPTPSTPCHEDPCNTLSQYMSESEQYLTSNTTIVFLPGEHVLQHNVTVSNVGRLAFIGSSSSPPASASRIACTDATLTFTNIHTLEIADLDFHSCTIKLNTSSAVFSKSRFENSTSIYGGAIYAHRSTTTFDGETRFDSNRAAVSGGGLFAEESNLTFHGNTTFSNNEAIEQGGGLVVNYCTASFSGVSRFISNSAGCGGGLNVQAGSTASFGVESIFIDNSAEWGGGVSIDGSTVSFGDSSGFINNSAGQGGGGVYVWNSTQSASFGVDSTFTDNSAEGYGGGVYIDGSTVSFGDSSIFVDNSAEDEGGGVYVWESNVSFGNDSGFIANSAVWGGGVSAEGIRFGSYSGFLNNSAEHGGGVCVWNSTVSLSDTNFTGNSADLFGGCIATRVGSIINVGGSSHFMNNSARYGGCIFVDTCNLAFSEATMFSGNSALTRSWHNGESDNVYDASHGGAILASKSKLSFHGSQGFTNNSAGYGGAVYLTADSKIHFLPNTTIYYGNNLAQYRGGALFVEDDPLTYCIIDSYVQTGVRDTCFIQTHVYEAGCTPFYQNHSTDLNQSIELQFHDNTANEAGSVLYGGNLVSCGVCTSRYLYVTGIVTFNIWTDIPSNLTSSDPYRVCICVDDHPDCNQSNTTREIFPGAIIVVPVVAFGQYDGTVPAVIHTYISENITLGSLQSTQQSNNMCTNFQYRVRSTRDINIWNEANSHPVRR